MGSEMCIRDRVVSSHFPSPELELVRRNMTILSTKEVVQRLEVQGEVDVTISSKGEVCVALFPMPRGLSVDPVPEQGRAGVPLKMSRKKKMYVHH